MVNLEHISKDELFDYCFKRNDHLEEDEEGTKIIKIPMWHIEHVYDRIIECLEISRGHDYLNEEGA